MQLSARDSAIVQALALRVRLLSQAQLIAQWWPATASGRHNAKERLRELVRAGLLERFQVLARPPQELKQPLCCWQPGKPVPDLAALAYQAQCRARTPPERLVIYAASARSGRVFGARGHQGGRLKSPPEAGHALALATVYLLLERRMPELTRTWVSEDQFGWDDDQAAKRPDAVLLGTDGRPRLLIDYLGAYGTKRLTALHELAIRKDLPYQWW